MEAKKRRDRKTGHYCCPNERSPFSRITCPQILPRELFYTTGIVERKREQGLCFTVDASGLREWGWGRGCGQPWSRMIFLLFPGPSLTWSKWALTMVQIHLVQQRGKGREGVVHHENRVQAALSFSQQNHRMGAREEKKILDGKWIIMESEWKGKSLLFFSHSQFFLFFARLLLHNILMNKGTSHAHTYTLAGKTSESRRTSWWVTSIPHCAPLSLSLSLSAPEARDKQQDRDTSCFHYMRVKRYKWWIATTVLMTDAAIPFFKKHVWPLVLIPRSWQSVSCVGNDGAAYPISRSANNGDLFYGLKFYREP